MPLALTIDTLDGVEEAHKSLYKEQDGGGFKLDVAGLPDVDKLVQNSEALLTEKKTAQTALKTLQDQIAADKLKKAEEGGDLKEVVETLTNQLKEQRSLNEANAEKAQKVEKGTVLTKLAGELAVKDAQRQDAIKSLAGAYVDHDGTKPIFKIDGVEVQRTVVVEHIKSKYPFLVDGTSANGSGANGSDKSGGAAGTMTRTEFNKLPPEAQHKATVVDKITLTDD